MVLSTTEIYWWLTIWNKTHFTKVCLLVFCILQLNTRVWNILNWLWVYRIALTCIARAHLILNYAIRWKTKFNIYSKTFMYKINPLCDFWVTEDVRVSSRSQECVPVASQGLCFSCITHRHVQTSRRDREANSQRREGYHTHTHTHARKYKDTTQRVTCGNFRLSHTPEMHDIL
jgi:hypothetical protein